MTAETSNARGEWDGTPTWRKQKPTRAGVYGVRGFNFGAPACEQFEAIVAVRLYNDELICNLHISTSEDDFDDWSLIADFNDEFEWCEFAATPPPPAAARGDVRGLDRLGWVRRDAIARLRNDLDVTGVMVHDEERTDSVPVYLAAEGVQAGGVEVRARELLAEARHTGRGEDWMAAAEALATALSQQPEARGVVDEDEVFRLAAGSHYGAEPNSYWDMDRDALLAFARALTEARNVR